MAASNIEGGNMTSDSIGGGGGSRDPQLVLLDKTTPLPSPGKFLLIGVGRAFERYDEYPYNFFGGSWSCPKWN